MGSIYMFRNRVNDKKYIGKSHVDANKRKRDHIRGDGNIPLKRAIDKYGIENFDFEILHDGIKDFLLDDYETEAIKQYNTVAPNGYNKTIGGSGVKTQRIRHKISVSVKKHIRERRKMIELLRKSDIEKIREASEAMSIETIKHKQQQSIKKAIYMYNKENNRNPRIH